MILVTARMTCVPGREEAFIAAATDVIARTTAEEPGCEAYRCSRDIIDPAEFVFVEEWQDGASLNQHVSTPHYREFAAGAKEMIAKQVVQIHTVEKTRTL